MIKKVATRMSVLIFGIAVMAMSYAASAPVTPQTVKLSVASGPVVWPMYGYSVAVSKILSRYSHLALTVETTSGVPPIIQGVAGGVMELGGPIDLTNIVSAYRGLADWRGKPQKNLRLLVTGGALFRTYITSAGSGIKTIPDLRGKTVPYYTSGHAQWAAFDPIMRAYGLDPRKDLKEVKVASDTDAHRDLQMGRMDAVASAVSSREWATLQESIGKLVLLPLDKDKVLKAKADDPEAMIARYPAVVEPSMFPGLKFAATPVMASPLILITNTNLSDDVAYTITKVMLEHYSEYRSQNLTATRETAALVPEVPYHPGAIKAFKEAGLWTDEMDKAQRALLAAQ